MEHVLRRRSGTGRTALRLTPQLFLTLLVGLLLAVLSFSQAAASMGMRLDSFRPLGGSFFAWRSGQDMLALDSLQKKRIDAQRYIASGQAGLRIAPLSGRSLWLLGKGFEAQNDLARARRVMTRAAQISRRESAVQHWLAEDAFRRAEIAEGLRHFDLIIRSQPTASAEILPRLVMISAAPEGRRYLRPYLNEMNPWYPSMLRVAVDTMPKSEPIGRLLLESGTKAPERAELRPIYSKLVSRLVEEGAQDIALQLYPQLPDANTASLRNVSGLERGKLDIGYPPFTWSLANDAFGATIIGLDGGSSGIEFFGAPGTIGTAASKLIAPKPAMQLRWRLHERSANLQSSANWVATCLSGKAKGAQQMSVNLLSETVIAGKAMVMPLPTDCEIVRLDMRIGGGIGISPANLIVGDLELPQATGAK